MGIFPLSCSAAASQSAPVIVLPYAYEVLFSTFAFILGASIGSFLNVCIYRMPRELSVNEPKRSFCPSCKYQIPWYHNLPLISWVLLRGRCAHCKASFSVRYFGVELLTGLLFLGVWWHVWPATWVLALPYWILVSLFVVATFIDFEFFIIPDEITWGGAVAGIILSLAFPTLMGTDSHVLGLLWSAFGAALGYGTLWAVVELGKKAFGKKRLQFEKPEPFSWIRQGDEAELVVGEDKQVWSDMFSRDSDRLLVRAPWVQVDGKRLENVSLEFHYERVRIGAKTWDLMDLERIAGELDEIVIPREAMGFGDVKFIAAIGAFLGWKAVFFTVFASSCVGAVVGLITIAVGKREWSAKIPFGPYLALGALLWLFAGPQIVDWYLRLSAV